MTRAKIQSQFNLTWIEDFSLPFELVPNLCGPVSLWLLLDTHQIEKAWTLFREICGILCFPVLVGKRGSQGYQSKYNEGKTHHLQLLSSLTPCVCACVCLCVCVRFRLKSGAGKRTVCSEVLSGVICLVYVAGTLE